MSRYAAGSTSIERIGAVIIPPTMGAAIRRMTSEPVPPPNMIGKSPAIITATVIAFGRTDDQFPKTFVGTVTQEERTSRAADARIDRAWRAGASGRPYFGGK